MVMAVLAALLLYAGWRGHWEPLQVVLAALFVREVWRRASVFVLALLLPIWPDD